MDVPEALASAAAGMRAQSAKLDAIAENLANAGTVGYRPRRAVLAGFGERLESTIVASTSQGGLRRTGVPTDLALVGPGAFAFAAASGVEYSRDGRLQVDPSGYLCDARGRRALGALGPARFPRGAHVDSDGRIVRGGQVLDRLRVVDERLPLTRGAAHVAALRAPTRAAIPPVFAIGTAARATTVTQASCSMRPRVSAGSASASGTRFLLRTDI